MGQLHVFFGHGNFDIGHFDFNPVFLGRLEAIRQILIKCAKVLNILKFNRCVDGPAQQDVQVRLRVLKIIFGQDNLLHGVGQLHLCLEQIVQGGHTHFIKIIGYILLGRYLFFRFLGHL